MKKTLLSITAVLVALTVLFAACQSPVNPSSITKTSAEDITEVSGPEWVKATAFRGGIFVSWAFNKDAKTYSVYRQRSDGLDPLVRVFTPIVGTSGDDQTTSTYSNFYYLDLVKPDNQLEDGVEYTYYVTTNSGQGLTGRAVTGGTDVTVILDGASKTTVTAIIPARYSEDTPPVWQDVSVLLDEDEDQVLDADAVKAEKVTTISSTTLTPTIPATTPPSYTIDSVSPGERLLLSWPHYNPGFKYSVAYDIGKALTLNTIIASSSPDPSTALGAYAFYGVPLFGGENTARITVKLGIDEYYYKPLTITKPLPSYTLDIIAGVSITSVTRSGTTAKIVWTAVDAAPNPANYKLYRIASPDVGDGGYNGSTAQITVVGDWTEVSIGASTSHNNTTITVQDTGLALNTGYLYALYAQVGNAKSAPDVYGAAAVSVPTTTTLNIQTYTVADASDSDILTYKVTLGWTKQDGVNSYTLLRAPVTNYPSNTGDFVTIGGTLTPDASGRYTVTDTPPIRKSYIYRLVAHDAAGSTVVAESDLDSDPFSDSVESALVVDDGKSTSIGTAYATEVTIGSPSGYLTDLYVDIYRATVPASASPSSGYQDIAVSDTAFTKIVDGRALKGNNLPYLDTGLVIGTNYVYRHVIRQGATAAAAVEITNTAKTTGGSPVPVVDFTGYVATASVPGVSSSASLAGTSVSGSNTTYYFTISGGTLDNLQGANVQTQARAGTAGTGGNWGSSNIGGGTITRTSSSGLTTPVAVPANTYYFTITRPTTLTGTNDYRLVLADQDGNVASYDASSATVLVTDSTLGW